MRELTIRIRFTQHCLGNVTGSRGKMLLPRDADEALVFMPSWHKKNTKLAAAIHGRHQQEVQKILWDPKIDVVLMDRPWHKLHYRAPKSKRSYYVLHEAIFPDQLVGINCLVPDAITDDDLIALMNIVGRYMGISPYKPGEHGRFVVDNIIARRKVRSEPEEEEKTLQKKLP